MKTVKIKTGELTGPALDWAVAEAVGVELYNEHHGEDLRILIDPIYGICTAWAPSSNWHQCGPLIEEYRVETLFSGGMTYSKLSGLKDASGCDQTPLIAACRAIVSAKLGDEVEVPEKLCTH